ncbi:hypothetical protein LQZ18_01620 [Lachnospiraceae bacterium ZAX-1]
MARKNTLEAQKEPPKVKATYTVNDLSKVARTEFSLPPEVVSTALKAAGKTEATAEEAKQIIENFLKRRIL